MRRESLVTSGERSSERRKLGGGRSTDLESAPTGLRARACLMRSIRKDYTTVTTTTAPAPTMDEIMEVAFKVVGELGAAMAAPHVYIGDRMDLFKTLASGGPTTIESLAAKTGLQER